MNYYEHHLGDYDGATAHLSWFEDCAYRRMIGIYYRSEAPLPADIKQVCRLVRAASKQEREAVEQVLREFFTLTDEGYRQQRCDADIARFQDKQRKAKASAIARWSKSDGNADAYANASAEDMRTHTERNADGMHRAPVPRHQTPDNYVDADASTPLGAPARTPARPGRKAPPDRPPEVPEQVWADWLQLRKAKRAPVTQTVLDDAIEEAGKAGLTVAAFLRVWCARGSQGLQADWLRPNERGRPAPPDAEPEWRREQRERNEAFLGPAAARRRTAATAATTVDMEAADAAPRLVG